ncbi:unnamed protein product, partial [Phaeothamnion confervicola]
AVAVSGLVGKSIESCCLRQASCRHRTPVCGSFGCSDLSVSVCWFLGGVGCLLLGRSYARRHRFTSLDTRITPRRYCFFSFGVSLVLVSAARHLVFCLLTAVYVSRCCRIDDELCVNSRRP